MTSGSRYGNAPTTEDELEERLSKPTTGAIEALAACPGDVIVLGAGGKMGPSLVRMLRRADVAGERRVVAVSRFGSSGPHLADRTTRQLAADGADVMRVDLADRAALDSLPDAPNVFFLAGQKFGTTDSPGATWTSNVVVPAMIAERFSGARIVALSTGNVYPLTPVASGGSSEVDSPAPVGEYAWSCLGRERVLEHAATTKGMRVAIVRLNYAVDLRYGVMVDLAQRILSGAPIDLSMGHVNVIWQGDAVAQIIQCLPMAATPAWVVNVTGPEILSIRALSLELGRLLGRTPHFDGTESVDALLSNTTRAVATFGVPAMSSSRLIAWVAEWVGHGGVTLGKPTHFAEREGRF